LYIYNNILSARVLVTRFCSPHRQTRFAHVNILYIYHRRRRRRRASPKLIPLLLLSYRRDFINFRALRVLYYYYYYAFLHATRNILVYVYIHKPLHCPAPVLFPFTRIQNRQTDRRTRAVTKPNRPIVRVYRARLVCVWRSSRRRKIPENVYYNIACIEARK